MSRSSSVTSTERGDVVVLSLSGDFGLESAQDLQTALLGALNASLARIAIDLSDTGLFDSSAIGVMIAGDRRARSMDGLVRLAGPSATLRRALQVTHIDTVIGVYATVDEAIAAAPRR